MTTEAPYFWLRKIASHLREHDDIPIFGTTPPFNWEHFSSALAARFGVNGLSIHADAQSWRASSEIREGLGDHIVTMPISIAPLSGHAYWIMPKENLEKLTTWFMTGHTKARPPSSDHLIDGFYRYLLLQVLDTASGEEPLNELSILLQNSALLPDVDAFCIDVKIELGKQSCWGRIAIDPTLQKSWRTHFSKADENYIPSKIAQLTELIVGIKVGSVELDPQEWKSLKKGDFILLDEGTYQPRKETGAAYLTVGTMPLFQVKVKHNKIELLDYAFMQEEEMDPNKEPSGFTEHGEAELFRPAEEEAVTLKELPIHVTVELARLRIR